MHIPVRFEFSSPMKCLVLYPLIGSWSRKLETPWTNKHSRCTTRNDTCVRTSTHDAQRETTLHVWTSTHLSSARNVTRCTRNDTPCTNRHSRSSTRTDTPCKNKHSFQPNEKRHSMCEQAFTVKKMATLTRVQHCSAWPRHPRLWPRQQQASNPHCPPLGRKRRKARAGVL